MRLLRAIALIGVLAFSFCVVGCSGQGGTTPPVSATEGAPPLNTTASSDAAASSDTTAISASSDTTALSTTSTATTLITAGVPRHVQTAEYLMTAREATTSPSVYAPYLSWAYANQNRLGMTQRAGIKTVIYVTPIMPFINTYEYTTLKGPYASVRATTCTGGAITTYNGRGLLWNPTKTYAASYTRAVVGHATAAARAANPGYAQPWNLIYIDNDGPLYGASSMPCGYNTSTWSATQDANLATTGQKFILNSLSVADSNVPTYVQRLAGSAISGGEFEECFMTGLWTSEGDAQLQAIALAKRLGRPPGAGFWCYADNTQATASTVIPQRLFIYASFLLTYDPNYSVFQESFTTPSTFKVYPETGFVPLSPVSVPAGISALRSSTGAYIQRYNACYYRGALLGHCEIIANPNAYSVAVPNPWALRHRMLLVGGGVLDGGYASFAGLVPSTMGPKSGLILTP